MASAVWVCVAALALLDRLDLVDKSLLGWWLSERQLPNGGLNGRPEKLEDVSLQLCLPSFFGWSCFPPIDYSPLEGYQCVFIVNDLHDDATELDWIIPD